MSINELLLILVVALIVLGPKRLPEAAKLLGKFVYHIRQMRSKVDDFVDEQVNHEILEQNERLASLAEQKEGE